MSLKTKIKPSLFYSGLILTLSNYACAAQDSISQERTFLSAFERNLLAVETAAPPSSSDSISQKIKRGVSSLGRAVAYVGEMFKSPPPSSFRLVEQEFEDGSIKVVFEGTEPNNLLKKLDEKIAVVTWFFGSSKEIAEKRSEKLLGKIIKAQARLKSSQGKFYTQWSQEDINDFLACTAYLREPGLSSRQISRVSKEMKLLVPPKLKSYFYAALENQNLTKEISEYDLLKKKISHLEKEQEALEESYKLLNDCLKTYKSLPAFIQGICHLANLYPDCLSFRKGVYLPSKGQYSGSLPCFHWLGIKAPYTDAYDPLETDSKLKSTMEEKSYKEIKGIVEKVYNLLQNQFVMGKLNAKFFDAVSYPIRSQSSLLDSVDSYIERRKNENIELKDTFIEILQTFHKERCDYGKPLTPIKATD